MQIDSPRFGTLEVEPSRIIEFPVGLAGFEHCKRFTLFHPEAGSPRFFILQSVDEPAIAFYVAEPSQYGFHFEIELSDDELDLLHLADPSQAAVVVLLSKGEAEGDPVRANLNAPLVINLESRRGLQHLFRRLNYTLSDLGK